jgi:predicted nuclease with TOPRIM domain
MPQLQSAAIRFHWEYPEEYYDVQQDESFRSEVMQEGLKALAAIPGLKDLALRDMYNVNETCPEIIANRNKILPRLKSLRLNITNVNRGMEGSSDYAVCLLTT